MGQNQDIHFIWKSFLYGNKDAFAYIYNLYLDTLYRYGTKFCLDENLVKDAIQEVFLDLYLKRENNKTNPQNLKYYLILALKRNLIKKLQRERNFINENEIDEFSFQPVYCIEQLIIEYEEEEEVLKRINEILFQLSPGQKEVLYLRFNESLEYTEISQIMNISVESVRKQVYRALKVIREMYKKQLFVFFASVLH